MGGRGASSGISEKGNPYGSQFYCQKGGSQWQQRKIH